MAVISTSLHTISNVVKHEYGADYAYCRQLVKVNDTAATLAIGQVLGKVSADGKLLLVVSTSVLFKPLLTVRKMLLLSWLLLRLLLVRLIRKFWFTFVAQWA